MAFLDLFSERLRKSFFASLADGIAYSRDRFGAEYENDSQHYLSLLSKAFFPEGDIAGISDAFIRFNYDILKAETAFAKTGEYAAKLDEYEALVKTYYAQPAIMDGYLRGLYLTYFLWPHHYEILRFYRESLRAITPPPRQIIDIGAGHGLFSIAALEQFPGASAHAFDISPSSPPFLNALARAADLGDRVHATLGNIFEQSLEPVDLVLANELLEHLPDPGALVRKVAQSLRPDGAAFMTAAINAAQPDHIYLFRSETEVEALIAENGLSIQQSILVSHPKRKQHKVEPKILAMFLRHKRSKT